MRVYVAGPITGYDVDGPDPWAERRAAWDVACKKLVAEGHVAISPWELHPTPIEWDQALRADIMGLVTCEAIYLLKGYVNSKGAQLELHIARELGMSEMYEDHQESILEEADRIVSGDRGPQYGNPNANFEQTSELWSAYKKVPFTPSDVAAFMVLLKMARQAHRPKRDNLVDIAGYTKCWGMLV